MEREGSALRDFYRIGCAAGSERRARGGGGLGGKKEDGDFFVACACAGYIRVGPYPLLGEFL